MVLIGSNDVIGTLASAVLDGDDPTQTLRQLPHKLVRSCILPQLLRLLRAPPKYKLSADHVVGLQTMPPAPAKRSGGRDRVAAGKISRDQELHVADWVPNRLVVAGLPPIELTPLIQLAAPPQLLVEVRQAVQATNTVLQQALSELGQKSLAQVSNPGVPCSLKINIQLTHGC
jgi:hypothetical protein